jgi:hypothetical protein
VGRPNVGKSALFNRLIGFWPIVEDTPASRDRLCSATGAFSASSYGRYRPNADVARCEPAPSDPPSAEAAAEESDVIVMVARRPPPLGDVANILRRKRPDRDRRQ